MIMLDKLKPRLDEIAADNEWEHDFIQGLIIKKEEDPEYKLTGKQFSKLSEINDKWRNR